MWLATTEAVSWWLDEFREEAPVKPEARAALVPFLVKVGEGNVPWMYLDAKGFVTVGVGNMLPSLAAAMALDWVHAGTSVPATPADVAHAWEVVRSRRDLIGHGGGAFRGVTDITATPESIARLIDRDVTSYEAALRLDFPGYDDAPAPAQQGLMRLAWAMGPGFARGGRWPNFRAAWAAKQWRICAAESRIPELDATEPTANAQTAALFIAAAEEAEEQRGPDTLPEPIATTAALDISGGSDPDAA